MTEANKVINSNRYNIAFLSCVIAGLFLFYEIFQMTSFNTISLKLIDQLNLTTYELSKLSASYFYVCAIFLIPTGILFDRYPSKYLLLMACGLSTLGVLLLLISNSLPIAFIGRGLTGFGNAFAFLGCMRLASSWYPPARIALVMSLVITLGMSGGIVSQAPFEWLIRHIGWHDGMLANAFLGVVIMLLIFCILEEKPRFHNHKTTKMLSIHQLSEKMKTVLLKPHNWLCGIYTGFLNMPAMVLGSLWLGLYLTQALHYSSNHAANLSSLIFVGLIIGAPLVGWLSDRLHSHFIPMVVFSSIAVLVMLAIIWLPTSSTNMSILLLLLGICSGAQVLGYPIIAEVSHADHESSSLGFAAVLINMIGAGAQILFGWLMNYHAHITFIDNKPVYPLHQYQFALSSLVLMFFVSIFLVFGIRISGTKHLKT